MSECSRREFIRNGVIGSAGIATLGAGALLQTGSHTASANNRINRIKVITAPTHTAPGKNGSIITCPRHGPDCDRYYCARGRQEVDGANDIVNDVELLAGSYDDPFKGETYS